jgi:hypothetical protein
VRIGWSVLVVAIVAVGGCARVEVALPEVVVDGVFALPAAAARVGAPSRTWSDAEQVEYSVVSDAASVTISARTEVEFFDAAQASALDARLGGHAVEQIDLVVEELRVWDGLTGRELTTEAMGDTMGVETTIGATALGRSGRVTLDVAAREQVVGDLAGARAVTLAVGVAAYCAPELAELLPSRARLHLRLQPIVVVGL